MFRHNFFHRIATFAHLKVIFITPHTAFEFICAKKTLQNKMEQEFRTAAILILDYAFLNE